MARLRRRREVLGVVAIREDATRALADAIDAARGRDLEALHPRGQRVAIVRLDDQMEVRALDREVDDADAGLRAGGGERQLLGRRP